MSVADNCNASLMVDRNIEAGRGSKTAYVAQAESLTYEELRRQVNRMGHLLRNLGVRREQRVLLVLDDTTAFPIAFLGALRIGAVPVPVSVREKADHFRHFIEDSYAEVVVCDAEILPTLQSALTGHDVRYVARGAPPVAPPRERCADGVLAQHLIWRWTLSGTRRSRSSPRAPLGHEHGSIS